MAQAVLPDCFTGPVRRVCVCVAVSILPLQDICVWFCCAYFKKRKIIRGILF